MDVCRICLFGEPEKQINQIRSSKRDGNKGYSEILQFCLDIQVSEDSESTKKLCSKCYRKIISYYKFKTMALNNDAYLKSVKPESCVKEELDPIRAVAEPYLIPDPTDLKNMKSERVSVPIFVEEQDSSDKPLLKVEEQSVIGDNKGSHSLKLYSDDDTEMENTEAINETNFITGVDSERSLTKSKGNNILYKSFKTSSENVGGKAAATKNYTHGPGVCDQCGANVRNLKLHVVVHIPKHKRQKFPCNKCDKTFITYTSRKVHQNRWHLGKIGHCDICNKDFLDMKSHQLIMHNRDKLPFQCGVCQLRFRHQSALDMHITNHTKEKAFQCDHCEKKFRLKLLLSQHVRNVHENEKNYVCQHCSKAFFKKYHFTNHLRTHTKEKPFKCPLCDKCFTTTSTLKDHQYSHSTVKDHHCKLCTMSFVKAGNLRKHMVSHSSEKKFLCRYCGVGFKRSSPRKKHEYEKHEKNMLANNVPTLLVLDCN